MGFIRLAALGLIVMGIAYFLVSMYSRSVRREKLEDEWDENPANGDEKTARDAYITQGMKDYEGSVRKKFILLIFILPTIAVFALIYLNNFS